jgi:hypothetical protein
VGTFSTAAVWKTAGGHCDKGECRSGKNASGIERDFRNKAALKIVGSLLRKIGGM